ncbi:hypothetical protein [Mycoplasma sp. P36-A1]|uniref:hypothetical protein n=1 Tax=Mycoplasma sp. P36-A1 TaxID=3252900 RepID=UPI003C2FB1CE
MNNNQLETILDINNYQKLKNIELYNNELNYIYKSILANEEVMNDLINSEISLYQCDDECTLIYTKPLNLDNSKIAIDDTK